MLEWCGLNSENCRVPAGIRRSVPVEHIEHSSHCVNTHSAERLVIEQGGKSQRCRNSD